MRFQEGDRAYIVVNNTITKPCTVVSCSGGLCVISLREGGAIRVRESRLYRKAEDTGKPVAGVVKQPAPEPVQRAKKEKTPWDWV